MFTPEEILAHHEKSTIVRRLPLEQAVQHVNGPVYGLVEELFGLQCRVHLLGIKNSMRLGYVYNSTDEPYHDDIPRGFTITTSLTTFPYVEGRDPMGISYMGFLKHGRDSRFCSDISLSQHFKGADAVFIIEGKSFKGSISHRADPVLYSRVNIQHERVVIKAEALGPSIEELIEIVESLHDLNGKAGE
jgi:hypothetical protein